MKHRLTLDYALGAGGLEPYLRGLREGVAMASLCLRCNRVAFPPERTCRCRSKDKAAGWKELSGSAEIVHRTDGPAGSFALVRFDGADNQAVCRLVNPAAGGNRALLKAAGEEAPALIVELVGEVIETVE